MKVGRTTSPGCPGSEASNVRKALAELSTFARAPLAISESDYVADVVSAMQRVFPQKAAYAGEAGLRSLISEGTAEAEHGGAQRRLGNGPSSPS